MNRIALIPLAVCLLCASVLCVVAVAGGDTASVTELLVRSDPTDAEVLLDGVPVGHTPLELACAVPGKHVVTVRSDAYVPWSSEVECTPGKTTDVNVRLARTDPQATEIVRVSEAALLVPAATGKIGAGREVASVILLPVTGSPRTRRLRVFVSRSDNGGARLEALLEGGFPAETQVVQATGMVSLLVPEHYTVDDGRTRAAIETGGIATIVAGQVSEREPSVRVEVGLQSGAAVAVHQDLAQGWVSLETNTEPPDPPPTPAPPTVTYPVPFRRLALTFDDFPSPGVSESLLSVLKAHGVPATFFVIGRKAAADPWLLRRAVAEGHLLGNHGYTHERLNGLSYEQVTSEINRCSRVIREATGISPRYFRPPGGQRNGNVRLAAAEAGLRLTMWDASSEDYNDPPPAKIVRDVLKTARGKDNVIVGLHDGHWSTIRALPELIHQLRLRGYMLVTLDGLYGG